ncbi:transposase [Sphingomonas sp.]|uniref:transposase n=1 Tax=Sphingomonas sp. TaxID=28214 RepID=UPI0035C831F9
MKKTRHTEEQIAFALKQAETGTAVSAVIRRMGGISEQTFYRWKKVYSGLGVGELRRLKLLEEENRNLTQLVADLSLDRWTSAGRVSRRTIPSWSRSTGGCGTSA